MNLRFVLVPTLLSFLAGCATVEQIASDAVSDAVGGALSNKTRDVATGYTTSSEDVYVVYAERTSRDYGDIVLSKTEKNPEGKTMVILENCKHKRVGNVDCRGYLYEVSEEGWIVEDHITLDLYESSYDRLTLAAGTYYLKVASSGTGKEYYATGEVAFEPFVTNYINLELE